MDTSNCNISIPGFEFAPELIDAAMARRGLLSIEIELSRLCNFRCPYCYASAKGDAATELDDAQLRDVIVQAQELGARKIIVLGGEPMLHPRLFSTLEFIHERGLESEMFTNGTGISARKARLLYELQVNVALKMNTFDRRTQDMLAGHDGAYDIIHAALRNLTEAGYPGPGLRPFLAVSTIMCSLNEHELVKLWIWLRDRNILPYFEMVTPQGNAVENDWLPLDPERNRQIFEEIRRIDRERYDQTWLPQPPLVAHRCQRHKFSCLVNAQGEVMPCVGVPIVVGNVRERRLADILADSEVVHDLRNHRQWIKGPCGQCEMSEHCYGCRGAAYNLTGDYLGSDPRCWRNLDRQDEVDQLPAPVASDIPHQPPMRIVDTLLAVGERSAETLTEIRPDMPFVDADGKLDEIMYLEIVAQSIAALNGFRERVNGNRSQGYLLGAKSFRVHRSAAVGDVLNVVVRKTAKFGDFGIINGVIRRGETVLAEGDIKVWHTNGKGDGTE